MSLEISDDCDVQNCPFWQIDAKTTQQTAAVREAAVALQRSLYNCVEAALERSDDLLFRQSVAARLESALLNTARPEANSADAVLCDADCLLHATHIENVLFCRYYYTDRGLYAEKARVLEYSLLTNGYYLLTHFGPDVVCSLPTSKLAEGTPTAEWREAQMARLLKDLHRARRNSNNSQRKGMFMCPKCKLYETDYYSLQTRSADEPMTNFVTCFPCNFRFRR